MRTVFDEFVRKMRVKRLNNLENRLQYKSKIMDLKATLHANSNSLLWVWEFSKKAVLICFIFYVIVQIYSMVTMVVFCDFAYLGDLINKTGEIVETCVFGYLCKAGVENASKIIVKRKEPKDDEPAG